MEKILSSVQFRNSTYAVSFPMNEPNMWFLIRKIMVTCQIIMNYKSEEEREEKRGKGGFI